MSKIAGNPYPGSRAFRQADQAFFFGREADTTAIINLWMTNRLTVLSGPVACGKTSLLQAGVCPSMPAKRSSVLPVGNLFHGMTFPFPALADQNPFTLALLTSWSPEDLPSRLAGLSISDFVCRVAGGEDRAIYAAIDQLDDLVLSPRCDAHAKWRRQFLAELTRAIVDHPRLHLLLVTRSEALSLLTSSVGGGAQHAITGLTTQGAIGAVTSPAEAAGRLFAEAAAESMIDDLVTQGAVGSIEPSLLQLICWQLWEQLPPSVTEISDDVIREFSDADAALASRCGQVIGEVAALYDIPSKRLRSWLIDTFVTDSATRGGTHEGTHDVAGLPNAVSRSLCERHLLTSEIDESVRYYRLLTSRLVEPLLKTSVDRLAAPSPAGYLRAAERNLAVGELDWARTHGEHVLRAASNAGLRERAGAESLLGNVHHERGQPAKALPHYRRAAELLQATGDTAAAVYQLAAAGQILLAEGEPTDALTELRAAVERAPNDLGLQTQLALALWQLGDGRGAIAILSWVLTVNGGHVAARRARGEILADLGDGHNAMLDLDRTAPGRPSTRAARGLALAELGEYTAATQEINDAVAAARRSGPVLLYAARASELAGDKVSARERAREALDATDPPLSPAHKRLASKLAGRKSGFARTYQRRS